MTAFALLQEGSIRLDDAAVSLHELLLLRAAHRASLAFNFGFNDGQVATTQIFFTAAFTLATFLTFCIP